MGTRARARDRRSTHELASLSVTVANQSDEPSALLGTPAMFDGATIELYGAKLLVVIVRPQILADAYESQLLVLAFRARFRRTIVLVTQDARGVPTYYGPAAIVRALSGLPFDALSWRRYRFRRPPPQQLPIPIDPEPLATDSQGSCSLQRHAGYRASGRGSEQSTVRGKPRG